MPTKSLKGKLQKGSIAEEMFYSREENPYWLNPELRKKIEGLLSLKYPDFNFLYPDLEVEALSDNELTDIAEGKPIQQVLGMPELPNPYHLIRERYPNLPESYPEVDLTKLTESELEKLARGESIEKTLGIAPRTSENHYESIQKQAELAQQALDPRNQRRYNNGKIGNVRETGYVRGKGNVRDMGNGNYRHGKSPGSI